MIKYHKKVTKSTFIKKGKKLLNNTKNFILDNQQYKKVKKLIHTPSKFTEDFFKKRPELKPRAEKFSEKIPFSSWHYILYKGYLERGYLGKAERSMKLVIKFNKKPIYFYELGITLKKRKMWWQAVDAFSNAINLSSQPKPSWYKEYALCLTQMNRHNDASNAWEHALVSNNKNANDWFLYGYALEQSGEDEKSQDAYKKAIKYDKELNAKELGIGIFHQKRGQWIPASDAYKKATLENPLNATLYYNLALSLDRCYKWEEAEEVYLTAIALKPENIDWYYRLGFVRERQEKFSLAAEAYSHAAKHRKTHTPYWYYRLGYVLNKANKHKESCAAFLMMKNIILFHEDKAVALTTYEKTEETKAHSHSSDTLHHSITKTHEKLQKLLDIVQETLACDSTRNDLWYKVAKTYEKLNNTEKATHAFRQVLARKENFDGNLYFSLGHMLALQGKYEEASSAFIEQRVMQNAHGILENYYNKTPSVKKIVDYTEYYERYPLEEHTILYESYHARSISGNPYAIFKSLRKDERFENYKHIWIINDKSKIPNELKSDKNIIFIARNCDLYMRYLAKTKYLINNTSFPEYFIRKEGQIYLNTWHGTPIKTLGKDINEDFMAHKNIAKNFLHASHFISPNQHTTDILLSRFGVEGVLNATIAETGYPRQDLMLNITEASKINIKDKLKITSDKKVILYAPTWRGSTGKASIDIEKLESDLQKIQNNTKNIHLLFRGHYMLEEAFNNFDINITIVPPDIDTNTLLSIVDILITDYSSISFDFMALSRPILYYVYDKKEYEEERGLYFPLEELGGDICNNITELVTSLQKALDNSAINQTQKDAQKRFCSYDDGMSTQRVIDLVFFNNLKEVNIITLQPKKSLLFYGGSFLANGITTSFINLIQNIDKEKYNITIVIDPNAIKKDEVKLQQFNRLGNEINVVARVGRMTMSLEEKWIIEKFNAQKILATHEMRTLYNQSFNREFKRIFGTTHFDAIINFDGYGVFWPSIFSRTDNLQKNIIYLHSNMYEEYIMKYPNLESTFRLYPYFDTLCSVSTHTNTNNKENFTQRFFIDSNKFKYCDNLLLPDALLANAKEKLSPRDLKIFNNSTVFINIARLSPEKDHQKLIRAFAKIAFKKSKTKLIIIGDGPLKGSLESLIKELNLKNKVFLLGYKFNPMPYLKKSSCFVLSSNHEGQGLVLLEAMILQVPVISTDIEGPRSVLSAHPDHLVENSEAGLTQGMLDFLDGKHKHNKIFDYTEYNQHALDMFYEKVLDDKE